MNTIKYSILLCACFSASFLLTSCTDDNPGEALGTVKVELTDGPMDDPNIQGVFVTVAAIEIDGQPLADFSGKQTIELSAYQNGSTRLMGSDLIPAGTYEDIKLSLDLLSDANGNSPGCYVLTTDGTRHPLTIEGNTEGKLSVSNSSFRVEDQQTTDVVIDFDLRKALRYQDNGAQDQYDFVANSDLGTSLRLVSKEESGSIRGLVDQNAVVGDNAKVIAFAYADGTYNENNETQAQGSGQTLFPNAVTSANISANGDYMLSFLKAGSYEVIYAVFEDSNNDGKAEFKGTCSVGLTGNLSISPGMLNVEAGAAVNLDISLLSIRP